MEPDDMSPSAAAAKRSTTTAAVPVPEVLDALARREAADIERQDRLLKAYREAVTLAAEGKPIPSSVADAAIEAAHALGLKASRMDADVVTMRAALACEKRMHDYKQKTADRDARGTAIQAELRETEQRLRSLRAEAYRLSVTHVEWVNAKSQLSELQKERPHLFKPAADMDEKSWRHVRA